MHRQLQMTSRVRRSDQGKGALEPDLVIRGCPVWHELQRGGPSYYDPLMKLKQAERDVLAAGSELMPVSVCARNGSSAISVCTRTRTLLRLQDLAYPDDSPAWYGDIPVTFSMDFYMGLLRDDYGRKQS